MGQEARHQRCTCHGVLWPLLSEGVTHRLRVEASVMCWEDTQVSGDLLPLRAGGEGLVLGSGQPSLGTGLEIQPQRRVGGKKSCQSAAFALAGRTDPQQDDGRLRAAQGEAILTWGSLPPAKGESHAGAWAAALSTGDPAWPSVSVL